MNSRNSQNGFANPNPYSYRPAPGDGFEHPQINAPTYTAAKKKARSEKNARRAIVLLATVALLFTAAWLISGAIQRWHETHNPLTSNIVTQPTPPAAAPSIPEPSGIALDELPGADNASWNLASSIEGEKPPVTSPDSRMIALPENGRIGMEYFDTAVFVGDSLTQGLQIYTQGIPNAKYCAYKGASPRAIYSGEAVRRLDGASEIPMDALVSYQPDNVYILMGTNAMVAMDDESLLAYYGEMVDAMKAALHPEVSIYIQSITPVLQGVDPRFDFDRIANLNNALAQMSIEKNCYFLDLHEALAGNDGWMRGDYGATRDGYHMNPSGYAAWVDYLRTHTAYNRRHAHLYEAGIHYYQQSPSATEG